MAANMPGATLSGNVFAAAGNTRLICGPCLTTNACVPPGASVTVLDTVPTEDIVVNVTWPAGKRSVYATRLDGMFNCFDAAVEVALALFNFSGESSDPCPSTSRPPSTDKNGSFSAAVPTLFHAPVPFRKDVMICAVGSEADSMLAMPFAFCTHSPVNPSNPPEPTWQKGTTCVRPGI